MKLYLLMFLAGLFIGCSPSTINEPTISEEQNPLKNRKEGLVVHHRKNGEVLSEINYSNNKKNGLAKSYYKGGVIHQEIDYENGVKHGMAHTYYENGKLSRSTPYKRNIVDGVQKKYRLNGELLAEIPYKNGKPGKGLKEYLKGGKLKSKYPHIKIEPVDNIIKNNTYFLKLGLSEKMKKVEFYVGELEDGHLHDKLLRVVPRSLKGDHELEFFVPPGNFIMKEINIICEAYTLLGNPLILEKRYNLAIENKGF